MRADGDCWRFKRALGRTIVRPIVTGTKKEDRNGGPLSSVCGNLAYYVSDAALTYPPDYAIGLTVKDALWHAMVY